LVIAQAAQLFPGLVTERTRSRGVLPYQAIRSLIESGHIAGKGLDELQVQPASLDLRLGEVAYQVGASLLPGKKAGVLEAAKYLQMQTIDLTKPQLLLKGCVYIIPAMEVLNLPRGVMAKANPKSTTGRLDVFARLIANNADQFDHVETGYKGPIFVEVAPKTFNVRVQAGTMLNQLRFLLRRPSKWDTSQQAQASETLVFSKTGEPLKATVRGGVWLTVDLAEEPGPTLGWKARSNTPVVDFERIDHYDPAEYWEPIHANPRGDLILNPGEFYILGSKERVRVPPSFAAEMVPYDPGMGEFRAHYAGFFDPGFGYGEMRGTRAILEVRSHDVPYLLRDGQAIARLIYEGLTEAPEKLYGEGLPSSYQDQHLGLAKQFRRSSPAIS
jgi:dCTP deaminase